MTLGPARPQYGSPRGPECAGAGPPSWHEVAAVLALTALAAGLRTWRLGDLPPGLHVDEAFNLLDARSVLDGARPVYLAANAGRDVLYTYLQAPLVAALGMVPAAGRLASAVAGTLAVPATWFMARRLPGLATPRLAVAAAGYMAVIYWPLHFSRFGIRAILLVPVVALAAAAWGRILAGGGSRATTAGLTLILAAAAYTHAAGRGLVLLLAIQAAWSWARGDRGPARALGAAAGGALILASPLIAYWYGHPGQFLGHAAEVSVAGDLRAVATNAAKVAGMFNVAGDPAPWRNLARGGPLPGVAAAAWTGPRPVFDPVTGALFLVGLALAVSRARRGSPGAGLVLIWLAGLAAPSVLADAAPNFSRSIGALPMVVLLPALALDRLAGRMSSRAAAALVATALAGAGLLSAHDYFVTWDRDWRTPLAFDADKVDMGRRASQEMALGRWVFLTPGAAAHPTVAVAAGRPLRGFDPRAGMVYGAGPGAANRYLYLAYETAAAAAAGRRLAGGAPGATRHPVAAVAERLAPSGATADPGGPRAPALLELSALTPGGSALLPGSRRVAATFGRRLRLAAVAAPPRVGAGDTFTLSLAWVAEAAPGEGLHTFVHLTADGHTLAQQDGPPVGGSFPTARWQAGDRVVVDHVMAAPAPPAGG
ncbi:MAG: hypothetical protein ACE5EL_06550, partial [Anaerolineae bacterium]